MAGAWLLGLAGLVGLGLAGAPDASQGVTPTPGVSGAAAAGDNAAGPQAAAVTGGPTSDQASSATTPSRLRSSRSIITLDAPATANQHIASKQIVVRGHVRGGTARVQVLLQSRSAGAVVIRTVAVRSEAHGGAGHFRLAFEAVLPLPEPRPFGPAVVQLVAYDEVGRARDMLLVPVQIGPSPADSPVLGARRTTGEDGLMGGIVSGTSFTGEGTRD